MVFSVYSRSSASALAAAAAFANTLFDNCVLVRASGKQGRETSHYSDLLSQAEILQRRQALFAGTNDTLGGAAAFFVNLSRAGISEAFGFLVIRMSCVLLLLSGPPHNLTAHLQAFP
jgi:hypothetical protein